jgi:MFS family permease
MAGAYMIIESWLNEKASNENRGTVFGLYMIVSYASLVAGQMIVVLGDVSNEGLFMVAGIFFCLALIPTAVSSAATPKPLEDVALDLKGLYATSPLALIGCFLTGVANGAWGTLGAVYGARIGISNTGIAVMASTVVLAGAAFQFPVGRLSDITDRRYVLAGAAVGAAAFALLIFVLQPRSAALVIVTTAAYGALAYTLYSVAVAHANDHARPDEFVKVSSSLLLLYGFGTMAGPVLGAVLMAEMRPESLFLATALAHTLLAAYALVRISSRRPVLRAAKEAFRTLPVEQAGTPESLRLDPRTG